MVERIIELSARNRWVVFALVAAMSIWAIDSIRRTPLDAVTGDRSGLTRGSVATLRTTLIQQGIVVAVICIVFLFHARSALVVMIILSLSVLFSFIAMRYFGLTSNIMSLGGIAIAIGELADAATVLIENALLFGAQCPLRGTGKPLSLPARSR